jgi:hypothetical protein
MPRNRYMVVIVLLTFFVPLPRHSPLGDQQETGPAQALNSPFRVASINDEISRDLGRACEIAVREFRMQWSGGVFSEQDGRQMPDTIAVTLDFPDDIFVTKQSTRNSDVLACRVHRSCSGLYHSQGNG